jgi:hypothetical protein
MMMSKTPGSLDALSEHNDVMRDRKAAEAKAEAVREFEMACNTIALVFPADSEQRRIAITARGDLREANGEART